MLSKASLLMNTKLIILFLISSVLTSGCSTFFAATNNPKKFSGTISHHYHGNDFRPSGKSEYYWINSDSNNAKNWSLYKETYQILDIYKREREEGAIVPTIYVCVEGNALTKPYKDGDGYLGLRLSNITFTEITSAKAGAC